MKTLHLSIIAVLFFAFFFGLHLIEKFQAFGDGEVQDKYNNTMRLSIQSSPTPLNLQPPQDRQIHLRFFDANTNKPIDNVVFGMNVTKGNQIFLYNDFYTKSGSFTLNLKPGERYLWSASPDHDPMDGLYYSKGDQIDIDTSYLTGDLYHFEFYPILWADIETHQKAGIKFETTLNLLDTYNKTIAPYSGPHHTIAPYSGPHHTITTDSPLKQFKSGIDPYHVTCRQDLQLLIKLKNSSPACVKSTSTARLLEQGWTSAYDRNNNYNSTLQNNTVNSTSALKLDLSTDSNTIKPGQEFGITISVSNTHANLIDVPSANNWYYGNVSTGPCSTIGYGVSILDGFYDEYNVTKGKNLDLFFPGTLCPVSYETASVYEFQPSSDTVKEIKCKQIPGITCPTETYQMGQTYEFSGYWDQGKVQPFSSGVKTLVGADEWGHVAIEHFMVSNSTIFAGDLGPISCPVTFGGGVQFGVTIKNVTGFANYYNSTQYGYTFFLHPGMQGTVNAQYQSPADAAQFESNGSAPLNMTSSAALLYMENVTEGKSIVSYAVSLYNDEVGYHSMICHYNLSAGRGFMEPCDSDNTGNIPPGELPYASNVLHVGIDTWVKPSFVMLSPNTSPVFTGTVSAKPDAMPGVYWLSLEGSLCGPGVLAKLVVLP